MCSSFVINAKVLSDFSALKSMNHELNKNPWAVYQRLEVQKDQFDNMSFEYKFWWLYRKAQAENLLFLFEQFQQTVATAQGLVNKNTSAQFSSQFNLFGGIILQRQGQYQQAQNLLKSAKSVAESNNLTHIAVFAKQELAYTRSLIQDYQVSLQELQQAYVEAFSLNDVFLIAKINEVYGAIYGYMHDYKKSIEYYQKALTSYQQLQYPSDIAEATNGMAATYRYWKKYDLAIGYYRRYEKAIKFSPSNIDGKFYAAYGVGMSQAEKGDCSQALITIDQALSLKGLIDYKAELNKRKAQCLIASKQLVAAKNALDKASIIFSQIPELKDTRWQIEVIKIRAELAQASGDSNHAYELLKDFNQKEVALIKKNSSDKLLQVRAALEQDKQNAEIALLQQRAKVQNLQFEQQTQENTFQTYIIAFSIILILMVLAFVLFQWQHNKKLLALSIRDPLSGLFNRRYVFSFFNKRMNAVDIEKNQVSIMVIDIDNFKEINDLYGHPFGDYVIREIARIGQETLRVEDVMGRVGGEEFLCVLPRTDSTQSMLIARRFVKNVNSYDFVIESKFDEKQTVNITISVGVTTTSDEVEGPNHMYVQADKALYQAKGNGKNCAVQYSPEMMQLYTPSLM